MSAARRLRMIGWVLVLHSGTSAAQKPGGDTCITAYESAQKLKLSGDLLAARTELEKCIAPSCNELAREDCTKWLSEVEAAMPSFVLSVRDEDGRDRFEGTVSIDGKVVATTISSDPIEQNPGTHVVRVEHEGRSAEEKIVLLPNEKKRVIKLMLPSPKKPPPPPPPETPAKPRSALPFVLAGVGVVAIGSFAYFGLRSSRELRDVKDSGCAPRCDASEVDAIKTRMIVGDVSLGIGVVALGVAGWLWLSDDDSSNKKTSVGVMAAPGSAFASLRFHF